MNEIIANKKVKKIIAIFIIISLFVISLAIFFNLRRFQQAPNSDTNTSVDKASGKKISTFTGYKPEGTDGIIYVDFDLFSQYGMSINLVEEIKTIVREYAKTNWDQKLERVSLYKDSYKDNIKSSEVTMNLALNNDKKDISIRIKLKGYERYEIFLYEGKDLQKQVKTSSYCSVVVCPPKVDPNNVKGVQGHEPQNP